MQTAIEAFIRKEILKLDKKREEIEIKIDNHPKNNCRLEELQTEKFKIDIIINYLGQFIQGGD